MQARWSEGREEVSLSVRSHQHGSALASHTGAMVHNGALVCLQDAVV